MSFSITWHGHATFTLDLDGTKLVVDPFFASHNPSAKTSVNDIQAHYILQTHGHGDHIADTIPLAKHTNAQVVANFEICTWINGKGHDNTHPMNTGGGWNFPFGRVKMTWARHSSTLPDGSGGGNPGGFLVFAGGKTIYFAGDTDVFSDMALIGRHKIDVAVLPVGDNFTMGPEDSLLAIEMLKPQIVIPGHYNTWPPIAINVNAWAESVSANTSAKPAVLKVDEEYSFA